MVSMIYDECKDLRGQSWYDNMVLIVGFFERRRLV